DYVDFWREAPASERPSHRETLQHALERLGRELDRQAEPFPFLRVVALELDTQGIGTLARWNTPADSGQVFTDRLDLTPSGEPPQVTLNLRYRIAPALVDGVRNLEVSYRRILLGLLGLSGFSLLCLAYMV